MGLYYPNLQPSSWASGWIVTENPITCQQNIDVVDFIGPALWYFHFARRLLEVLFVHEYRVRDTHYDVHHESCANSTTPFVAFDFW
jgi:hypothetical protein